MPQFGLRPIRLLSAAFWQLLIACSICACGSFDGGFPSKCVTECIVWVRAKAGGAPRYHEPRHQTIVRIVGPTAAGHRRHGRGGSFRSSIRAFPARASHTTTGGLAQLENAAVEPSNFECLTGQLRAAPRTTRAADERAFAATPHLWDDQPRVQQLAVRPRQSAIHPPLRAIHWENGWSKRTRRSCRSQGQAISGPRRGRRRLQDAPVAIVVCRFSREV